MPKGTPGRPPCTVDGCNSPNDAQGFCRLHYQRWAKHGDPLAGGKRTRLEQFTASYIEDASGCWLWTASLVTGGYGAFWDRRAITAHRWAYLHFVGPIADGLHVDHLCRQRRCVNPMHLQAVTIAENVLRGEGLSAINARKTHCKRGHVFDAANTHHGPSGERVCRKCKAAHAREARRAKSVA